MGNTSFIIKGNLFSTYDDNKSLHNCLYSAKFDEGMEKYIHDLNDEKLEMYVNDMDGKIQQINEDIRNHGNKYNSVLIDNITKTRYLVTLLNRELLNRKYTIPNKEVDIKNKEEK